ncbi:MAG: NAD-dependent epimerase/dehydratase family protein [Acidimicrobiales bacterium]
MESPLAPTEKLAVLFGGAGFIGRHLAHALRESGWRVVIADICDNDQPASGLGTARVIPCDVRLPIELTLPSTPDLVVNLAAVHRTPGHPAHEYYDTNVSGALNITGWCQKMGVSRLIFTSSISVYGAGEHLKQETTPTCPNSNYGRSKLLAEQIHERWLDRPGARQLIIARPAVVFGPGENGNFTRLASALSRRRFAYPGRTDTIKSCGHVQDLVRALIFGLDSGQRLYRFNYCYPDRYSISQICQAFHDVAGFPLPRLIPMAPVTRALHATPGLRSLRPVSDLLARASKLTASTNVAPMALMESGFQWETDLESGLRNWFEHFPEGIFI